MPHRTSVPLGRGLAATLLALAVASVSPTPARADIALCRSYPRPHSNETALTRSLFAFDGVLMSGRSVRQDGRTVLISPRSFRVRTWIKRGSPSSGAEVI